MLRFHMMISLLFLSAILSTAVAVEDVEYWLIQGQDRLRETLQQKHLTHPAKNVIIFIGDGMGISTVTASRIFQGQTKGFLGEETYLSFETFPYVGLAKTYNVDRQVPDSAATATALFCGAKTNYYVVGLDATAEPNVCKAEQTRLNCLASWAQEAGKHVGIVTTTRVTHATPSAMYAGSNNRNWECDEEIPVEQRGCLKDIALQLVEDEPGRSLKVVLGGGWRPLGINDSGDDLECCVRHDGRNLVEEWKEGAAGRRFVSTKQQLMDIDVDSTEQLMGLFNSDHMPYRVLRREQHPSLINMTVQAIKMLKKGPDGFVLMVEAGRIDYGHHANLARIALQETVELSEAVEAAKALTNPDDTLIIVTADHSHTLTINGYPKRGNDITGYANDPSEPPYETLSYANGPGFYQHRINGSSTPNNTWREVPDEERSQNLYRSIATLYLKDETHGGEDVAVYSTGPRSYLLSGVFEQNYVAHAVAYATCIGISSTTSCLSSAAFVPTVNFFFLAIIFTILRTTQCYLEVR